MDPLGVPPPGSTLGVLAETPAVRLFVDRVRDVQPGFTLTSQNAPAVAEVCRRLDGLPLALELAAASMRLLTPDQVLARLPGQLERPGALADLPGRQQTLTGTIQWSYDLLPAPAQQMLARLSVFAAPFTAAAAEAVAAPDAPAKADAPAEAVVGPVAGDAMQDLSTLLDHSMVSPAERPDGERAFRLLNRSAASQPPSSSTPMRRSATSNGICSASWRPPVRGMARMTGTCAGSTVSSRTCMPCSPGSSATAGRRTG